jgi:DNA-binding response OmpR family regulator
MSDPLILVVDDEPQILRAVERTLLARDFRVATATDGRAAVGAVRDREPDLVVLDLNLPHVDGLTACREIRRSARCRSSCCRCATPSRTRSPRSTSAPTTT